MTQAVPFFHYLPGGYGWANTSLFFGKVRLSFLASYIGGNPLMDMVSSLAAIAAGSTEPQVCEWLSEPGYLEMTLVREGEEVRIRGGLIRNESYLVEDEAGVPQWDLVLEVKLPLRDLAENLVGEADRWLAETGGPEAFIEGWDEDADPFPTPALSALRALLAG